MKRVIFIIAITMTSAISFAQTNYAYGQGRYYRGISELCNGNYWEAYTTFVDGADYNPINYEGIGVCYELGFGVSVDHTKALNAYRIGANNNVNSCRQHLNRINQNGFWDEDYQSTFLRNLRAAYGSGGGGGNIGSFNNGGYNNNSSGSSSIYTKCKSCNGTGNCTLCNGNKGYYDYNVYSGRYWTSCPACRGTGNCQVCYGRGKL